jgi:epoxyqueuosine reductase QueG
MQKDAIDQAPHLEAGEEVMRIYASLGKIVNEIAKWLRDQGIKAQSDHPFGGLVCTPPLAGKAGMGWIGRNGCLITPEFGPLVRIAPIFVQGKIFSYMDKLNHQWIEEYCKKCRLCEKNCPGNAIFSEKKMSIPDIPGIGSMRTCIDREKCFPYFNKDMGCSICIKVCPFSKGQNMYHRFKTVVEKNIVE